MLRQGSGPVSPAKGQPVKVRSQQLRVTGSAQLAGGTAMDCRPSRRTPKDGVAPSLAACVDAASPWMIRRASKQQGT